MSQTLPNHPSPQRIVIVGGVAGGASAATRARRLSEQAEIVLVERGPHISFANCGLPYHVGGVIADRDKLLVQTPEALRRRFNIDVRTGTEVTAIDRTDRRLTLRDGATGEERTLDYDKLILSPGASPIRPPLPGIDHPAVLTLRNLADMDRILAAAERHGRALVIGAGYIGLEMVDNLHRRGIHVTLIEKLDQVFPLLDKEMAAQVADHLSLHGVELLLGDGLAGFCDGPDGGVRATLESGRTVDGDFAVLAIGVRPENTLARNAGLQIGPTGGIVVNEHMQTSDPDIYAVGDSVQVQDTVTGRPALIPLAGPANRQGRIAANHILGGRPDRYDSTQGTSIVGVFDLTVATTGASERNLARAGIESRRAYLHPANHAGYYPGAAPMHIKLLYAPGDGRVLGAQIVGGQGVDKRIDVLAVAVRHKLTVYDLEELELAYAPPFGSAKDPVNMAGFIAVNALEGVSDQAHFDELPDDAFILDVRTDQEFALGHLPGARHIPVDQLRDRLAELPRDKTVYLYCGVGQRAYVAERILKAHDIASANLSGGWKTWCASHAMDHPAGCPSTRPAAKANDRNTNAGPTGSGGIVNTASSTPAGKPGPASASGPQSSPKAQATHAAAIATAASVEQLDARGLQCPGPILQLSRRMGEANLLPGHRICVRATDPGFLPDVKSWAAMTGHRLIEARPENGHYLALVEKSALRNDVQINPQPGDGQAIGNGFTAVVFSGSMDRALASLILANGAAANGMKSTLFFTFWGLSVLRKGKNAPGHKRGLLDRMFAWMLPGSVRKLKLSQWHFAGFGRVLMNYRMKSKQVMNLDQLLAAARDSGVRLVACQMSLDMLGLKKEDLIDGVEVGGVANFMEAASAGRVSLFI